MQNEQKGILIICTSIDVDKKIEKRFRDAKVVRPMFGG